MCKRFEEWSVEIEKFCSINGFSYAKAQKMSKSWGKDDLVLQYHDQQKGREGLLDETPMPVVLWIKRENGTLKFEQTEYTQKYLSM